VDTQPGIVGKRHLHYRQATNGMVIREDDQLILRNYHETLPGGERHLTFSEKTTLSSCWSTIQKSLDCDNVDPTSEWNGTVG
jgi:hypothetical protein